MLYEVIKVQHELKSVDSGSLKTKEPFIFCLYVYGVLYIAVSKTVSLGAFISISPFVEFETE